MKKKVTFKVCDFGAVVWLMLILAGFGGWIANIVKLLESDFTEMSGLIVARIIGVFFGPLGAVLGFM